MVNQVKYTDINSRWFNAKCLNLIAKYAKHAAYLDNIKIRVNSEDCLLSIVEHAKQTDSLTLKLICRDLKNELRMMLADKGLQPQPSASEQYQNTIADHAPKKNNSSYQN